MKKNKEILEDIIELELYLRKKKFHLYRHGINCWIVRRFEDNSGYNNWQRKRESSGLKTKRETKSPPLNKNIMKKDKIYQRVFIKWIDSTMRSQVWWNAYDILEDIKNYERKDYIY